MIVAKLTFLTVTVTGRFNISNAQLLAIYSKLILKCLPICLKKKLGLITETSDPYTKNGTGLIVKGMNLNETHPFEIYDE